MVGAQYPPAGGNTAPLPRIPAAPSPAGGYLLKGLGLVAVAVVSGLVWWLIRHEPAPPVAQAQPKEFAFAVTEGPVVSTDCAAKSTDEVKAWFSAHPCQKLARALYTTTSGSARALVSVVLVTTASPAEANELKALADTDGTGNVKDLIRDNTARIPDAPNLAGGEYESRASGNQVTIVLAGFYAGHTDDPALHRMTTEALDLSAGLGK